MEDAPPPEVAALVAAAIARAPIEDQAVTRLEKLLDRPAVRSAAATALLLAGTPSVGALLARIAAWPEADRTALVRSADVWAPTLRSSLGGIDRTLRWATRADRVAKTRAPGLETSWLFAAFADELRNLHDTGPRTWTRPSLRRAVTAEVEADPVGAAAALFVVGEEGTLLALAEREDDVGHAARSALAARAPAGR